MDKPLRLLALVIGACWLTCAALASPDAAARLNRIYEDYWEEFLRANPFSATFAGDHRFDAEWGFTNAAEANADTRARAEKYLALTAAIDPSTLGGEDRISYDLFRFNLQETLDGLAFPFQLLPVNQIFSVHLLFAQLASGQGAQPFRTVPDYERWLQRARGFAPTVDGMIADMREGIRRGIVLPKALAAPVVPQLANLASENLETTVFMGPARNFPAEFSDADKARLTEALRKLTLESIVPAYRRLHEFMRDEYLPHCRETVAWSALPGGPEWYEFLVRSHTTLELGAAEIHEIGLREVARIRGELERARERVGFTGTLREFYRHLDTAPERNFTTREEIQAAYEALRTTVDARIPQFFRRAPRAQFVIRAIESYREKSGAVAHYVLSAPDGSRPGIFYYNAYRPETRSRATITALFLHEAIPGHHFETSFAQEMESLPKFRRFGGYSAFSEGWALYAEKLGEDMRLYDDPYQWVGRLAGEIWRAARLVVDTGLHTRGWTREQAIAYMLENVPQNEVAMTAEVDRYIAAPGQALSYKLGEIRIRELRARAERELGAKFELREFHDEVLAHGPLPIPVLEAAVHRWIEARRG